MSNHEAWLAQSRAASPSLGRCSSPDTTAGEQPPRNMFSRDCEPGGTRHAHATRRRRMRALKDARGGCGSGRQAEENGRCPMARRERAHPLLARPVVPLPVRVQPRQRAHHMQHRHRRRPDHAKGEGLYHVDGAKPVQDFALDLEMQAIILGRRPLHRQILRRQRGCGCHQCWPSCPPSSSCCCCALHRRQWQPRAYRRRTWRRARALQHWRRSECGRRPHKPCSDKLSPHAY